MVLFKYLRPDRIDVLEQGMIRFTQPDCLNDPFESLPFVDTLMPRNEIEKYIQDVFKMVQNNKEYGEEDFRATLDKFYSDYCIPVEARAVAEKIRNSMSFDDMIRMGFELAKPIFNNYLGLESNDFKIGAQLGVKNSFSSRFGVLCLTANICSILMWSHYTDGHRGYAIGFESRHQWFGTKQSKEEMIGTLKKVCYSNSRPEFNGFSFEKDERLQIVKVFEDFIFTKSKLWAYEKEWRMIQELEKADKMINNGEDVRLFKFPPEAVNCVVLGCSMTKQNQERVKEILRNGKKYKKVELFQAGADAKTFNLNFLEVKS